LLTIGSAAGPLYDAYYSTNGTTYTLASDGSNLSLPSTSSSVAVTVPDNSTQIKLVNKSEGCNDNSFIVPVVTTTTTTTSIPLRFQVTVPCVTACTTNGILTITSITGGSGPPYQTALIGFGRDTIIWNNYPEVSSYGNLQSSCSGATAIGQIGVRSVNSNYTVWAYPTLCTTTTLAPSTVVLLAMGTASTLSNTWTIYVNGVASDYKYRIGGSSLTVPANSQVKLEYGNSVCNVQYLSSQNPDVWVSYTSGQIFNAPSNGGVTWRLFNPNDLTFIKYVCQGNFYFTENVNPCGAFVYNRVYPESTCDCVCNPDCEGRYYLSPICGESVGFPNYLIRKEAYTCNNDLTGEYQILSTCSCQCNRTCIGEYSGDPYCGASNRNGKNPSSQYVDFFWSCDDVYIRTETLDDCSCSCNQTCDGEYWGDPYCDGTGIQKRNKKYVCNGANTGEVQTLSTCSEACGAFVAPIWSPFTAPYCEGCTQYQDEVQTNTCCVDPPSGSERTVPLGTSSECGTNNIEYYCVGFDKWSRLRNSCTNNTCCDTLVETNSPYCGYTNCSTWNIIAYNSGEFVNVEWTACGGGPSSTSFYSEFGGVVGSVCAQNGTTPSITSGNGAANNTGNVCSS
jgi:hypothetical protein